MRYLILALSLLIYPATSTYAQVSVGIGIALPGISIGINLPMFPSLVRVPGYPVYYAPQVDVNFFFYDGLYWVYEDDRWYAGSWYNGPWAEVEPEYVPLFILRVPIRYYRRPPVYFRDWRVDRPPRWDDRWGSDWARRHSGWDRWSRFSAPPPAPLPIYQRDYSGSRYPGSVEQQYTIRSQSYRYQPREPVIQQHYQLRNQPQEERQRPQQQVPQRQQQQQPPWQQQQAPQPPQRQPQRQQQQAPQQQQQEPPWQQQQRQQQVPQQPQRQQQQQQPEPQWQQRQQPEQNNNQGRSRAEQRQQASGAQYSPSQQQQNKQPGKRSPYIMPPEAEH
ncbi:hypothetical protein ACFPAG_16865 [Vogesella sp. GCM10023246]|uniref:YXWGXW repeat-containing protein n=1 Tax=Vogesella oryzagri TaxID=3160864 RepID=A0ABV1M7V1_9NEIS